MVGRVFLFGCEFLEFFLESSVFVFVAVFVCVLDIELLFG